MYHDNDNDGNLGSSKLPLPTIVGKVARSEEMFFKEISTNISGTFQSEPLSVLVGHLSVLCI